MTIEVLFPEVCNLYGDLANIRYLKESYKDFKIINTKLTDEPYFLKNKPDLIYMGTVTEHNQEIVIDTLKKYKKRIEELIKDNVHFLITGNALEVFGKEILCEDGRKIKCLGIYNTVAKRNMMNRYNCLYVGKFKDIDIVGFKSQFTHSYIDNKFTPLFKTVRSCGLNPDIMDEGIRINNFMATYVIGPLLILNPKFTKWLLVDLGVKKPKLAFEEEALDAYEYRLNDYMQKKNIYY
jgi:CobQ-like glutamine amidotransferase family enzyme